MTKIEKILNNLTLNYPYFSISSIKEELKKLKDRQNYLEDVHIYIESLSPKLYPPKKRYFHISKIEKPTKLDEWIFEHLIDEEEYRRYLDKYLPLKDSLKYNDVDEFILNKHYRPKAIKLLSRIKKNFNLKEWTKKRFGYSYRRKNNLLLKEGQEFPLDFRNSLESLFILKNQEDKWILARGGSGSSGQRMKYTMFTAIFYLLGKNSKIKHYLLKYNSFNEYEYIATFYRPIVTLNLGSNYPLDEGLRKEIIKNGIDYTKFLKSLKLL